MQYAPVAAVVLATSGSASHAQFGATNGRFEFGFDRLVVSPSNPEVTMTVYAAWDQASLGDFVLRAVNYDLLADSGEFTSAALILGMNPPNNAGQIKANRINGAAIGQVHITGGINIPGNPDNPIALAEYVWTATNYAARTVEFTTESTTHFALVPGPGGVSINLFPSQFTPRFGSIVVVPGSSVSGTLALGACLCAWRRRR